MNDTATSPASTFFELVSAWAGRAPLSLAVVSAQGRFSYAALEQRARRAAAALHAAGIGRGDRVGLLLANRIEWIDLCLGAGALGATTVPLSTWSTRSELAFLLDDAKLSLLVAQASFGERDFHADLLALKDGLGWPRAVWLLDGHGTPFTPFTPFTRFADVIEAAPTGDAVLAADPQSDALVLYTSGSTSAPKAVPLAQYAVVENAFNIGERQGLVPTDKVLLAAPLFWAYGGANALPATLSHGAALVLLEKFDAGAAIEAIERERCTAIYTLPAMTGAIARHPSYQKQRLASLRTGLTLGSPEEFLSQFEVLGARELCNVYGATETCGNCCVTWHHWPLERRARCQGPPLPGQELRFVDSETGLSVPPGAPGLVEVRGYTMRAYQGASAEQNAKAFSADGFYRTGDIGRLDADGAFVFVGRVSEMIKRAGINVSPAEVEASLRRHPSVIDVAVTGVPDAERGERIVAFVVTRSGERFDARALLAHCAAELSKYKLPDRIEACDALPLTVTGKLQRNELKRLAAALAPAPRR